MRYALYTLLLVLIVFASSCRKDFETIPNFGKLEFSKDTVFLDTIFTNIGSATYNLKVYNRGNRAITIPQIRLENGNTSNYRLNVDGIPGKEFSNIDILAKDSMFVFVETTINASTIANPLYTDKILFDTGNNQQNVALVTLVQDANFIYPGKDAVTMEIDSLILNGEKVTKGRFLNDAELTFTNAKPTVIYGYAAVPANKTLTINAGAKVYFHNNSGLIVAKNGSLKVNGTAAEKVTFQGDRLAQSFSQITGQWGTIWLRAGSKENEINYAQIKNGVIGVLVDSISSNTSPTLKLQNTEIYNHSNFGVLARETNIEAHNVVIGSAGQASLAATIGGTYNFTHSTFANYWSNDIRQLPAVLINNSFSYQQNGQEVIETRDLHAANFTNCIFEGNTDYELFIDKIPGGLFNYAFTNCFIKFNPTSIAIKDSPEMDFNNSNYFNNTVLNGKPDFRDAQKEDFIIGENSDAINKATSTTFPLDILGVNRSIAPDIGAYQHIIFN